MKLVYDYDGRMRTYVMKMDFICGEAKQGIHIYLLQLEYNLIY